MEERIDIALKNARELYKTAYEYEFDNKDDIDMTGEQFKYCLQLRDELMLLYWIKNEAVVKFEKFKIIVKWPNGENTIY